MWVDNSNTAASLPPLPLKMDGGLSACLPACLLPTCLLSCLLTCVLSFDTAGDVTRYHRATFSGPYARHCYGVVDGSWDKTKTEQQDIDSAQNMTGTATSAQVWVADLTKLAGGKPAKFDGLRNGKKRVVRAKYPNGDPERSGEW